MNKEEELVNAMIQRGYVSLDPTNKNNILLEVQYERNNVRTESVPILYAVLDICNRPEQYQEIKDTIFDVRKDKISLTEFLEFFNFDYSIVSDENDLNTKYIKLIDLTGANLGDIENDLLLVSNDMYALFDRLDIYFNDYIFKPLEEKLDKQYHCDTLNMTWERMYEYAKYHKISFEGKELCPYIFQEKQLNLTDYLNKMILNDIPFEYRGCKRREMKMENTEKLKENAKLFSLYVKGLIDINSIEIALSNLDNLELNQFSVEEFKDYLQLKIPSIGEQQEFECYLDGTNGSDMNNFSFCLVGPYGTETNVNVNKSTLSQEAYKLFDIYKELNNCDCIKIQKIDLLEKLEDNYRQIQAELKENNTTLEELYGIDIEDNPWIYLGYKCIKDTKKLDYYNISAQELISVCDVAVKKDFMSYDEIYEMTTEELYSAYNFYKDFIFETGLEM